MKKHVLFFAGLLTLALGTLPHLKAQAAPSTPVPDAAPATTPIDPAKVVEIRKLLAVSGTIKLMDQMKVQMFDIFQKQHPQVPPHVWQELEDQMDTRELLEKMLPIYDQNFSLSDLKALNAFYETPAGQRMLSAMPQVMRQSMAIGEEWGKNAAMKVEAQLRQERGTAGVPPAAAPATGK